MTTKPTKGAIKVELSERERDRIGSLLRDEYDRIMALPTEEPQGFTMGAKAATLADVTGLARKFGLVIK